MPSSEYPASIIFPILKITLSYSESFVPIDILIAISNVRVLWHHWEENICQNQGWMLFHCRGRGGFYHPTHEHRKAWSATAIFIWTHIALQSSFVFDDRLWIHQLNNSILVGSSAFIRTNRYPLNFNMLSARSSSLIEIDWLMIRKWSTLMKRIWWELEGTKIINQERREKSSIEENGKILLFAAVDRMMAFKTCCGQTDRQRENMFRWNRRMMEELHEANDNE